MKLFYIHFSHSNEEYLEEEKLHNFLITQLN